MKYLRIRIKTVAEAEDILVAECYDIGLEGAQIEDDVPLSAIDKEKMFVDILPDSEQTGGAAYVSFFLESDNEAGEGMYILDGEVLGTAEIKRRVEEILEGVKSYMDIGDGSLDISETNDINWVDNWKQYFHQFEVGGMLVLPSWEDPEERYAGLPVLGIDPGAAFGTGAHETTGLCIEQIRKHMSEGDYIMDVGTGSGILSIYAMLKGAGRCFATDLDPLAVMTAESNFLANGLGDVSVTIPEDRIEEWNKLGNEEILFEDLLENTCEDAKDGVSEEASGALTWEAGEHEDTEAPGDIGDVMTDAACRLEWGNITEDSVKDRAGRNAADIAVANILAEVLVELTPHIVQCIRPGGIYITSGILKGKEGMVQQAMEKAGLRVLETSFAGEWASVTGVM